MAGNLVVTTADNFEPSGFTGEFPTPATIEYVLTNAGSTSIDYTVTATEDWVYIYNPSGTLAASASVTVTVKINSRAKSLVAGMHTDTVVFTNTTDSIGDTTRGVSLVLTIKPYAINFLPVKLRTNEFFLWFCDLLDYTLKALQATDDPLLEVPNEFIDLIGGTTDTSNKKAIQAYYNTMVRPSIGTRWLMDTLMSMFETPYTIEEWYEYSGDSFKFRIKGDETSVDFSAEEKTKLIALINEFKNERSRLDGFIFEISFTDNITDITMSDLSLAGNKLEYYQRDGSITRDGTKTRGPHTTTPWS